MTTPIPRLNAALSGRYMIERELGEGGMATVYLADDERHERKVALKVLKPELAAIVGAERFLAEIKTTAGLQHPHILPLFDSGEADGFLFYVMPYVEGESLRQKLDREHQLPVDEVVRIATNVGEALDYAHRHGVIHRDIKPANILLQDGKPVVSDFGIALALGAAGRGRLTETGLSLGTPHYMSPEQATGDMSIGAATDVYALGCVLYEMLVGEPPYTGSTPQAVLGRIVTGEPRSVMEERSTVPAHVDAVVRRALEKVPADRFGTAGEMVRALGDAGFRWGEALTSSSGTGPNTPGWRVTATAALVACVVLLVMLANMWSAGRVPASVVHTSIVTPARETLVTSGHSFAITPDGSRIVYQVLVDGEGTEIRTRLLSESQAVSLTGTDGAGALFLSPDGESVAFVHSESRELRRVPLTGGPVEFVARVPPDEGGFYGGSWGPDGSIVIATEAGLRHVPPSGGVLAPLTDPVAEEARHRQPVFLPDDGGIVFTVSRGAFPELNEITFLGPDGNSTALTEGHSPQLARDGVLLWARGETSELWAARFDVDPPRLIEEPVLVHRGVQTTIGFTARRASYAVSETGTLLVAPADMGSGWSLVWVERDGTSRAILQQSDPALPSGGVGMHAARLSPDASRIAFTLVYEEAVEAPEYRIFIHELARGITTPLLVDANADWATWTPDGERLALNRFGEEVHDLFWARADNALRPEPLVLPNPAAEYPQDFTSDGSLLVIQEVSEGEDGRNLTLLSLADGETRPLVATTAHEYQADLSPDDRWLGYTSEEFGTQHVYVTDFPGAGTPRRISVEGGFNPVWGPRGDELLYRRASDGAVMSVPVSTDPDAGFEAGQPVVLFEGPYRTCCRQGRTFDVAPDGERFLMMRQEEAGTGVRRLDIVQNFAADVLRRLDPR